MNIKRNSEHQKQLNKKDDKKVEETDVKTKILSTTTHKKIPFSTISQILNYPQPTYRFRCKAKVIGYEPKDIKRFTKMICPYCQQ